VVDINKAEAYSDFRNRSEEEDDSKEEDEDGDAEINPLDGLKAAGV
jgi:hypothetical protein